MSVDVFYLNKPKTVSFGKEMSNLRHDVCEGTGAGGLDCPGEGATDTRCGVTTVLARTPLATYPTLWGAPGVA